MPKEALICSKYVIAQTEMASHVGQMFSISVYNQRRFHSPVRLHYYNLILLQGVVASIF